VAVERRYKNGKICRKNTYKRRYRKIRVSK
jgi:hypothetical protein